MDTKFRTALCLSPFSIGELNKGYVYRAGGITATTPEDLQKLYNAAGSTEMFVRIATKQYKKSDDPNDGNEVISSLEYGLNLCRIAARLDMPINPEIMCAYTYMDMFAQQAPDFIDYPEIYELQKGKLWKELTLDEMCRILEAYGEFIGGEIYETGCRVEHFNLGNEANFGFAGLSVGLENAVEPKLLKMTSVKGYQCSLLNPGWLKKHLWQRQAALLSALSCGLKKHYPDAKYDTHISLISAKSAVMQFQTWIENGYDVYEPGVSFYPSCPGPIKDRMGLLEDTVTQMGDKFDKRVFIAEYAYPSEKDMPEPYQNWTYEIKGYPLSEGSQAMLYHKLVSRGQEIGVSGIRYWGPDFSEWGAMPIFRFDKQNKTADGKKLLDELLEGGR